MGLNTLMLAIIGKHPHTLEQLVRKGADPCVECPDVDNQIIFAAQHGNREILEVIFKEIAAQDTWIFFDNYLLRWAVETGTIEIIAFLTQYLDINWIDPNTSLTARNVATIKGHIEAMKALLDVS